mgnify:CR=1 FL=1
MKGKLELIFSNTPVTNINKRFIIGLIAAMTVIGLDLFVEIFTSPVPVAASQVDSFLQIEESNAHNNKFTRLISLTEVPPSFLTKLFK